MERLILKRISLPTLLLLLLSLFLLTGLLPPACELLKAFFEVADPGSFFTPHNQRALFNTLWMGAAVALAASLAGLVIAYAIVKTRGNLSTAMRLLFPASLFAPSIMPAIGLIYLIGNNGLILQTPLYGAMGVFLGGLIFTLPHATLQLLITFEKMNARLFDAARSLQASPLKVFLTVALPQCRTGLFNAFLIAFVLTITDFGVPKLLGGNFPMLVTEIYNQVIGNQDYGAASFLCLWLLAPSVLAFYFSSKFHSSKKDVPESVGLRADRSAFTAAAVTLACVFLLFEVLSIVIVIYGSFVTFWPYVPELTLANYSFQNSTYGIRPWINSIILSVCVAFIGTLFCFAGAYLTARCPNQPVFLVKLYRVCATLPLCLPGTVLGLGFAMAFNGWAIFSDAIGAMALLVFNTLIHLYTVSHMTAANTLAHIDSRYETVAASLGVKRLATVRQVIIPLSYSGLREIFCYLLASSLTTISAVVFLYTPDTMPAAVAAIQMIDSGFISEGAAMSTLLFITALAARFAAMKAIRPRYDVKK